MSEKQKNTAMSHCYTAYAKYLYKILIQLGFGIRREGSVVKFEQRHDDLISGLGFT